MKSWQKSGSYRVVWGFDEVAVGYKALNKTRKGSCKHVVCRTLLRREGDSNPRYAFGVYTLSRRASSATRASLLLALAKVRKNFGNRGFCLEFFYIYPILFRRYVLHSCWSAGPPRRRSRRSWRPGSASRRPHRHSRCAFRDGGRAPYRGCRSRGRCD